MSQGRPALRRLLLGGVSLVVVGLACTTDGGMGPGIPQSLMVTPPQSTLQAGQTVQLSARLVDADGRNILEYIDFKRYTILPNTAGCFTAEDALRVARLGREILEGIDNPGASWVKLEVLADTKTLLPDPVATLEATEQLVKDGFQVLCYTSDDPISAKRLKDAGATSVMPAGSPIGSGQGILNPNNIRICLEYLKENDPDYPVIVDAGVGTAAALHLAAALPEDSPACGLATGSLLTEDIVVEPLSVRESRMAVPRGSGLGVEVDATKLAQYGGVERTLP